MITSTDQYSELINQLKVYKGSTSLIFRKKMSQLAFNQTAYYDAVISNYFNKISNINFPKKKVLYGNLIENLDTVKILIKKVLFIQVIQTIN